MKRQVTCWLAMESVHLEYVSFLNNDSTSKSTGFNESELDEYVERIYNTYLKAITAYYDNKSEIKGITIKMKSLLKRLGSLCDQYSELCNDPAYEKANLLMTIFKCLQPILDDATNWLYKLIHCKNVFEQFQDTVDTIVWRIDELKLYCSLQMDSCTNDVSNSPAQFKLGQSVYNGPGEKSLVTLCAEYSIESDAVSVPGAVYPVIHEYAVDVKPANMSSCSETESHLDKELNFAVPASYSPHGMYCKDPGPVPFSHTASTVSYYDTDSTCPLNLASSAPMEQLDSAFASSYVLNDKYMKYDRPSEFSGADSCRPEVNAVPKKQTDLSSDILETEHPLDYFDNSCHTASLNEIQD